MTAADAARALGDTPPAPTYDLDLAHWQGSIAAAAENGGGLDAYKAALEDVKEGAPSDRTLLERARQEIRATAERHLVDVHGAEALDAIFFSVFPEEATGNDAPDRETAKFAEHNEVDAEIQRLARLGPIEYDRQRKPAAEKLGIRRLAVLDAAVKAARVGNGNTRGQGRPLELHETGSWPDPVDGAALLVDVVAAIRKYVVLSVPEALAVALWCIATHAFDSFFVFPRLTVRSATPRCGKTTLRGVVAGLVAKPLAADSIMAAALFRTIELARPTLLLDEAETYLKDNENLRGILNSGHHRDGSVIRCVGDDHEPRAFSTWAPVMLAQIGRPPATVQDRSIVITLRRKKASERVEPFRPKARQELRLLAQKSVRWTRDNVANFALAEPAVLDFLNDRGNDNWWALLAIADGAGGTWPEQACLAAKILAEDTAADAATSVGEMLLADIREAFQDAPVPRVEAGNGPRLSSEHLAARLAAMEGRPWCEWGRNRQPLSKNQLARLLHDFRISSGTIRLDDGTTPKGYYLSSFEESFTRYLAPGIPSENATTPQVKDGAGFRHIGNATALSGVAFRKAGNCEEKPGCGVVANASPGLWEKDI